MSSHPTFGAHYSRRNVLYTALVAGAASALHPRTQSASSAEKAKTAVTKGNIKQSIVFWCFNVSGDKWDIEKQCQVAKQLGCVSIELGDHKDFPVIKKHGLTCAIAGNRMPGAPFMRVEQPRLSRRSDRSHERGDRRLCRIRLRQRDRFHGLQVEEGGRPQER